MLSRGVSSFRHISFIGCQVGKEEAGSYKVESWCKQALQEISMIHYCKNKPFYDSTTFCCIFSNFFNHISTLRTPLVVNNKKLHLYRLSKTIKDVL
jgi:hypothetical protein